MPRFSVSVRDDFTPDAARQALLLLTDDGFRDSIKSDPSLFYSDLGIDIGEGLLPDQVILPTKREVQEAIDVLDNYGEFRFKFQPFGFYTPAKNPFIGLLLLAAKVNDGG